METGIGSRRNNSIAHGGNMDTGLERMLGGGDRNASIDNRFTNRIQSGKALKMAGHSALSYVKRERFNEDTESTIKENLARKRSTKLTANKFNTLNGKEMKM